jgi:beta-glucanase (GH16 family)
MKFALLLLLTLASPAAAVAGPPSGYKLAWSDNFNGTSLDQAKWTYRTDSKLLSTQTPANVSVRNGDLVIALRKQDAGGMHYTGGGIISRQVFHYGYFEARLKIVAGSGWHSSFWLMGYNGVDTKGNKATLEMDIIENESQDLHSYTTTTHRWVPPHIARGHKTVSTPDLSKNFHVFGCEYAPNVVRYFFDGKLVQTVDLTGLPQGDVNIWLTSIAQAMGLAHDVGTRALPGRMIVDWVRYYKRESPR